MKKFTQEFLDSITVQGLHHFRKEAFTAYASTTTPQGRISLGVNGVGVYEVRLEDKALYAATSAFDAVDKFRELIVTIEEYHNTIKV